VATETASCDQAQLLDERDGDFDERLVDFEERPVDFDERDFDELEPAFAFEALLRDPEPLDFDELPRELLEPLLEREPLDFAELPRELLEPLLEREPLDFAELREAAVFPRDDPVLEVFEPREELLAFVFPDAREDLPPARWVLLWPRSERACSVSSSVACSSPAPLPSPSPSPPESSSLRSFFATPAAAVVARPTAAAVATFFFNELPSSSPCSVTSSVAIAQSPRRPFGV